MTRIVVLPSDETACGTYRMRWPAAAVRHVRTDWHIEVYRPHDVKLGADAKGDLVAMQGIPDPRRIDLLVVQRTGSKRLAQLVRWAQSNGTAVVLDADDALWCIAKSNPAHRAWETEHQHWRWLDAAAADADLVTVTTDLLAKRYGAHGRVEVLPNVVPVEATYLPSMKPSSSLADKVTVGWAGFTATHPGDLRVVGDAVKQAAKDTGAQVLVMGDAVGAARDWDLHPSTVAHVAGVPLGMDYYRALSMFDIGLVPLRNTTFNKAKSGLKAIEFSAMGVPVIASDTPAHRALVANRLPLRLVRTPEQWYSEIVDLVTSEQTRLLTGEMARERVAAQWSFTAAAREWAAAWERAMVRRAALR